MTIAVEWNSTEKHYLIANYYSGWTLSDFRKLKHEADSCLVSVDYLVDTLVIFHDHKNSDVHRPPTNVSVNIANAFDTAPTNLSNIYVVNADTIMTILIKIVQRPVSNSPAKNIQFVETFAEATQMIENSWQARRLETNQS